MYELFVIGNSLAQLVQREVSVPEPVKESKLVESDNLLMEFQEQSESEESDDGVEETFDIGLYVFLYIFGSAGCLPVGKSKEIGNFVKSGKSREISEIPLINISVT